TVARQEPRERGYRGRGHGRGTCPTASSWPRTPAAPAPVQRTPLDAPCTLTGAGPGARPETPRGSGLRWAEGQRDPWRRPGIAAEIERQGATARKNRPPIGAYAADPTIGAHHPTGGRSARPERVQCSAVRRVPV